MIRRLIRIIRGRCPQCGAEKMFVMFAAHDEWQCPNRRLHIIDADRRRRPK